MLTNISSDLVLMIPVAVFTPSLCSSSYCHQLCSGNLGNTTADNDGSVAKIECFCGTGYSNPGNSGNPGNPGDSGNTDESYCQMDSTGGQLFVCQDSGLLVSTGTFLIQSNQYCVLPYKTYLCGS